MANHYYDATGVLRLDRVTPVIRALFGAFLFDEAYPGNGEAFIARLSEGNDPQWGDIRDGLIDLAADLEIARPDDGDPPSMASILKALAGHFGAGPDDELARILVRGPFDDSDPAEMETLFLIATCFDDGHRLNALQFQGAWYCSRPRLMAFGGDGLFLSREVSLQSASDQVLTLGTELRQALLAEDVETASALIAQENLNRLCGVRDEGVRARLRQRVGERLLAGSVSRDA
ncbi:MAG: hypothetical protein LBS49_13235 [Candidatus Accumulibacter sp.]|jgi:hypothetical protein|nr:hypothetical protein [Accumulibacter sp.]